MLKKILLLFTLLIFTGCSSFSTFNYSKKKEEIKFKISKEQYLTKKLNNSKYIYTSDNCTNNSYLLKEKRYFIEYISIDTNCNWNGLASGYFEREFKSELKLNSMEILERIDIKNYSFATFKINDKYSLNIISIYTSFTDTFIIDFDGELYNELLSTLNPSYIYKYEELPRYKDDYNYSLVQYNFFHNYFNRESSVEIK